MRSTKQRAQEGNGTDRPEKSFAVSAPAINLPKGGGAIRGIGEKFAANPVIATGSMSMQIATSPGRSGSGNDPFGFGWSLSLPSIGPYGPLLSTSH